MNKFFSLFLLLSCTNNQDNWFIYRKSYSYKRTYPLHSSIFIIFLFLWCSVKEKYFFKLKFFFLLKLTYSHGKFHVYKTNNHTFFFPSLLMLSKYWHLIMYKRNKNNNVRFLSCQWSFLSSFTTRLLFSFLFLLLCLKGDS